MFVFFLLQLTNAMAAPCCGGGSAAPAIISGDDRYQLSATTSRSVVIGDAPEKGIPVFRSKNDNEITQSYRLDGAMVFAERLQAGVSLPFVQRAISKTSLKEEGTGFGDLRGNLGYEILPEWDYSVWKPRGFLFLQLTVPTGKSIYESTSPLATDATGRGFYSAGTGLLLVKNWSSWDALVIPEIHHSFTRSFKITDETITISPRFGASLLMGAGYNVGDFRIGMRIAPNYNQPKHIHSTTNGDRDTASQLAWDTGLDFAYIFKDTMSATLAYTDQTVLGPVINTTLSRTFAFTLQKRWDQ